MIDQLEDSAEINILSSYKLNNASVSNGLVLFSTHSQKIYYLIELN